MRIVFAFFCALVLTSGPALARVAPQMPAPMEEAPVQRAIENVARDHRLAPAQRERLLGRLHLIAYAQLRPHLTRWANGEWQPEGLGPCGDSAYAFEGEPRGICPFGMQGLGTPELPAQSSAWSFMARGHLYQARTHYQRALSIDDTNLRAHLGLAFVLDELNQHDEARLHLRRIIDLAEPRFETGPRGTYVAWEDHVVLSEVVEHLGALARSRADRAAIARLQARLGDSRPSGWVTPILVPLTDAPFDALTDVASSVAFDFAGTGDRRARGWLTDDAAWLVWDPNRRGDIRSGFDLIGQRTWAVFWSDGFEAMRSLDDNGDGELTGTELGGLAMWRDADGDGVSDAGEVAPVADFGVVALSVRGDAQRPDLLVAPRGVRFANGVELPLYDWTPGFGAAPGS